ncbi:valine--tRNA ligase [Phtheirospermum japonicum]|uniref:valine--tRNA ligase n=1 Tax=Phtheirospermum japonicum TaxID=374723 RepID=A0A830D3H0_9LAMI|nr:valine--tRNA ligase [Phtheirospermum japonicum]
MSKTYNPRAVENSWYDWWEKSSFFEADSESSKPPFVMVLPPPSVTGPLHVGDALTAAIQDTMIRWRRMSGYNTLWVPGIDHAGIATEAVVEKRLMRELKLTSHDVGRERFVAEIWQWKNKYGGTILKELRQLGASLDWSRECFTMDEKRSLAVAEAFVRLHNEGLVYRDIRFVNWDCVSRTAISNTEVKYIEIKGRTQLSVPGYEDPIEFGVLTSFAYPLEGGLGEIVVTTSRVETMFGDGAIVVHPNDPRYTHLHGKLALHPFVGRKLPIICDPEFVDMNFGTGAVAIIPAHDPKSFEVAKGRNHYVVNIFTDDGKINNYGGSDFAGMPRFRARVAVKEALKQKGLYRGDTDIELRLGICSVTNGVIEPRIKPQWYVKCKSMAQQCLDAAAVIDDDVNPKMEIIPNKYVADWQRYFEKVSDWCVSRQLSWGHRIPAWYVVLEDDELKAVGSYRNRWVVAKNGEVAQAEARRTYAGRSFELLQDPDVLDTWFSSAVYMLSMFGWSEEEDDAQTTSYSTSVLETGHDLLAPWVARTVMLGMKLRGDVPFRKVYVHPPVIDFSKGIPECGADALRFALVSYTNQHQVRNNNKHTHNLFCLQNFPFLLIVIFCSFSRTRR